MAVFTTVEAAAPAMGQQCNWVEGFGVPGTDGPFDAFTLFDDGTGLALYVGGYFNMAGNVPANNVAKWDGNGWAPLGLGVNNSVQALATFDDGTGPALYVGGFFTSAGGMGASNIAKWVNQIPRRSRRFSRPPRPSQLRRLQGSSSGDRRTRFFEPGCSKGSPGPVCVDLELIN